MSHRTDDLVDLQVANDPIMRAIATACEVAVGRALAGHLPTLTLSRPEAAKVLGLSPATVDRLKAAGELDQIVAGRITLASVLRVAGWPLAPAPLAAPLAVVPSAGAA